MSNFLDEISGLSHSVVFLYFFSLITIDTENNVLYFLLSKSIHKYQILIVMRVTYISYQTFTAILWDFWIRGIFVYPFIYFSLLIKSQVIHSHFFFPPFQRLRWLRRWSRTEWNIQESSLWPSQHSPYCWLDAPQEATGELWDRDQECITDSVLPSLSSWSHIINLLLPDWYLLYADATLYIFQPV